MSKIIDDVIETAKDLHKAGVMDEVTMRDFDALSLPPVKKYSPAEIRRIRLKAGVSQPVFAAFINASSSTVKAWEQGDKHPQGTSLKLLEIVEREGLEVLVRGRSERT